MLVKQEFKSYDAIWKMNRQGMFYYFPVTVLSSERKSGLVEVMSLTRIFTKFCRPQLMLLPVSELQGVEEFELPVQGV